MGKSLKSSHANTKHAKWIKNQKTNQANRKTKKEDTTDEKIKEKPIYTKKLKSTMPLSQNGITNKHQKGFIESDPNRNRV